MQGNGGVTAGKVLANVEVHKSSKLSEFILIISENRSSIFSINQYIDLVLSKHFVYVFTLVNT